LSTKPPNRLGDRVSQTSRGITLGLELPFVLVGCIAIGGATGWLLDRWLHTAPAFLLILGGLGFAGGMASVIRRLRS